jgi:hypothetical protein
VLFLANFATPPPFKAVRFFQTDVIRQSARPAEAVRFCAGGRGFPFPPLTGLLYRLKAVFEIAYDVVDVLGADGKPHGVGFDSLFQKLAFA